MAVAGGGKPHGQLAEPGPVRPAEPVEIGVERVAHERGRRAGAARRLLADDVGISGAQMRLALGETDQAGAVLDQSGLAERDRPRLADRRAEAESAVQPG